MPLADLFSELCLTISCKDIASSDWLSKSDPMVEMYMKKDKDSEYEQVGATEMQKDTYSPTFALKIECRYTFEVKQYCKFVVYDVDGPDAKQVVGFYECSLAKIVGSRHSHLVDAQLTSDDEGKELGLISILAETVKGRKTDMLNLTLRGQNLANKDGMFGASDPYVKIKAVRGDGTVEDIANNKTPYITDEPNPTWQPLAVNMFDLCRGDFEKTVRIEVWDYDGASGDDQIGFVNTTLAQVFEGGELVLLDYKDPPRENMVPGSVFFVSGNIARVPHFFDFVQGGIELTASLAVDFTASNKKCDDPESLHYLEGDEPNQYQSAITSVCSILEEYDHDKRFAAYGYGAILENLGKDEADHCFALTMDEGNAEVDGTEGVLEVYQAAVSAVRLYGPTNFAEVIEQSIILANECRKSHYQVLLILTDGDITDMQETKDAIVKGSNSPLSIIIVGVGDEDFEMMSELDADKGALQATNGEFAARDIVQFVPYKAAVCDPEGLAAGVLRELPKQLLSYMCVNKRVPPAFEANIPVPFSVPEGDWFSMYYLG
eukprot:Tamp_10872.p1 GENE.Tamp_10872~~Tamp_10872.p1  ORF type:complete len:554 (+),score=125.91 Tamp_10872:24-1664(+)